MFLFETLRSIVAIVAVFSVTVFVHELGHFLFMKLFGVRVERFAIGFGKRLFGFQWTGTDFCFCAFPFGGYVKPVGMHSKEFDEMMEKESTATPPEQAPTVSRTISAQPANEPASSPQGLAESVADEISAMRNKAWWQKVIILAAGCAFNLLAAAFAVFLLFWVGHRISAPQPALVEDVSGTEHLHRVRKGDLILAVNGKPVANGEQAYDALEAAGKTDTPTTTVLLLRRNGEELTAAISVHPDPTWPRNQEDIAFIDGRSIKRPGDIPGVIRSIGELRDVPTVRVGIREAGGVIRETTVPMAAIATHLWFPTSLRFRSPAYIEAILPNLPAEKAGLRKGDTIVAVAGKPVASSHEAREAIMARLNQETQITASRQESSLAIQVTRDVKVLVTANPLQPERGRIGIVFGTPKTELRQYDFFPAIVEGFRRVGTALRSSWHAMGMVFSSGSLSFIGENVGGPIAIGVMTAQAASHGWVDLVMLFVMFNVTLAIINIMPIPVLDGGHIVFATIEAIIGRPIPVRVFVAIHNAFIILILTLALTLTLNDVFRNAWRIFGVFQ
jgi:regulator of sigma E protease